MIDEVRLGRLFPFAVGLGLASRDTQIAHLSVGSAIQYRKEPRMPTRSGRRGYTMGLQSAESVPAGGSGAQDCTTYWHRIGGAVLDLGYLPVETQILIFVHEAHLRRTPRLLLIRMTREVLWGKGGRVRR